MVNVSVFYAVTAVMFVCVLHRVTVVVNSTD